jgi:hypothetical protein
VTADAYLLQWPERRKRTESWHRENAKFDVTFARARDNIIGEVQRLCGRYPDPSIVISTNIALRRDGLPLAGQRQPDDPGVAVYFTYKKRQMSFACDRWRKIEHNMQAIAKTIEALRGIARWGTGDMLEAAFTGFEALPAPQTNGAARPRTWREVMEFPPQALVSADMVSARFRRLASVRHPDAGGSHDAMSELNRARDEALAAVQ